MPSFRYKFGELFYTFEVEGPYSAGHVLTKGEAQALNQMRTENIRENMREPARKVASSAEGGDLVAPTTLDAIQQMIGKYDAEYQFPELPEEKAKLSTLELEARNLARARLPDDADEATIQALAESIELVSEAQERLKIRSKIAKETIEDLIG